MEHEITTIAAIKQFVLAGRAIFTLSRPEIGSRLTFKFSKPKDKDNPVFVGVLSGPDNESSYAYLGVLRTDGDKITYHHGHKSRITEEAISSKTAYWFVQHLIRGKELPRSVRFYHSGKCGKCGRTLTVPESIHAGLGPICGGRNTMQTELPLGT